LKKLREYSLDTLLNLNKRALDQMDLFLTNDAKKRICNSVIRESLSQDVVFADNVLVEAYLHIPKPHRFIISFMISHFQK
jgi:hypothetical protein